MCCFKKIKLIAILGPTAVGKSELAVDLAKKINGEIISADSMQIYKKMNIATAKIDKRQQKGIVHHLVDCVDLNTEFSVVDYVKQARRSLNEIVLKNKKPILVGGTGLYVDGLLKEYSFGELKNCEKIRANLLEELKNKGPDYMFEKLKKIDEDYAKKQHVNNMRRVMRALELYYSTGVTMSERVKLNKNNVKKFHCLKIGLNFFDRKKLYDRINARVDLMMERGLLNEVREILKLSGSFNCTAMQAIGYKEFSSFFLGDETLEEAVLKLKKNTRHLAKRQLTWFRKDDEIKWFFIDKLDKFQILDEILSLAEKFFC